MRPQTAEMVKREAQELADRVKLLAHHDQLTTPEDGLVGYKWTFSFGATPFPAIMPVGPHPRDAGERALDQVAAANERPRPRSNTIAPNDRVRTLPGHLTPRTGRRKLTLTGPSARQLASRKRTFSRTSAHDPEAFSPVSPLPALTHLGHSRHSQND
jgi:hypothetical protein